MCFSAPASFVAGASLSTLGILSVKKTRFSKEVLFAIIPFFFGVQQLIEGLVWLSFGYSTFNTVVSFIFLMFSHVLWPIFIPISVFLLEENRGRRRILLALLCFGLIIGLYFLASIFSAPFASQIVGSSIVYTYGDVYPPFSLYATYLYFLATYVACLCSSHRIIILFGLVQFLSSLIAFYYYAYAFVSVWCFLAAILSIIVYWFIADRRAAEKRK